MSATVVILLVLLPCLLVVSGFFSGSETALFSLPRRERMRLGRQQHLTARALQTLLEDTRGLLITLLLCNMVVNVSYFAIASMVSLRLGTAAPWLPAVLNLGFLLLLILGGEVLPKIAASRIPLAWAHAIALPMLLCHRVLLPIRWFASLFVITPLARLLAPIHQPVALSAEDLQVLLKLSEDRGVIDADEEKLLQQALLLRETKVKHLMIPRVDMVAHDLADPPSALLELIHRHRLRMIPVYRENVDTICGVVASRQVLLEKPTSQEAVEAMVRQVRFVPALQSADRLLIDLRRSGDTLAIAVDEYGGTEGVIALRDVVEFLIGDLPTGERPGQQQPVPIEQIAPGRWQVGAALSVRQWMQLFRNPHSRHHDPNESLLPHASTLGGLMLALFGRIPAQGDQLRIGNLLLSVAEMQAHRIHRVTVEIAPSSAGKAGDHAH